MLPENIEKTKQLALQLANWDKRIVEIVAIKDLTESKEEKLDLICSFDPEPDDDAVGFFWVAMLLTRMEFEALDEQLGICQPLNLGFKVGGQIFLPNGKIINKAENLIVLWPNNEE